MLVITLFIYTLKKKYSDLDLQLFRHQRFPSHLNASKIFLQ